MSPRNRQQLFEAAKAFCDTFAEKKPPEEIFKCFSDSETTLIWEHGLPQLAPFLGRKFRGEDGVREYFGLLSNLLSYESMSFSRYVVDPYNGLVSVRGEARFTWMETQQSWDEVFTYVLEFDDSAKVKLYEIWADSGAAYLASKGKLGQT